MPHPRQRVGRRVRRAPHGGDEGPSSCPTWGGSSWPGWSLGARQLTWLWAPYVNSYKRYVPGSWAPTAAVWGVDNRTCGFRLVGQGEGRRVECRIPGADANPYLALAAIIAAGLWGVEHGLELAAPFAGNAYDATDVARVPTTLVEAIAELEASPVAAPRSARTCTTTCSTPPARSGSGPTGWSPTGSSPATSSASDPTPPGRARRAAVGRVSAG